MRPLVPAEGLLVVVGRLLTVGRVVLVLPLTRPVVVVELAVGRLLTLPDTLLVEEPAPVVPERLPPLWVRRPSLAKLWLMEPAVPLGCLTLAT